MMERFTPDPAQSTAQGRDYFQKKQFDLAAECFLAARTAYQNAGDAAASAEAANNLAVCYLQTNHPDLALELIKDTPAVFNACGNALLEGQAYGNLGMVFEALNKPQDALEAYHQSEEILAKAGDRDSRSYVLGRISALQIRAGKQIQALQSMEAALENRTNLTVSEKFLKNLITKASQLLRGKS